MDGETVGNANPEHASAPKLEHNKTSTSRKHPFTIESLSKYKKHVIVSVFYLAVALIMFYPSAINITTVAHGSGADIYQNLWDIWWVNYAVFHLHTNAFFTKILFWPIGANLAYATLAPLLGVLSAPFQAVSIVFGYNIMFFLGFMLSGLGMFILADYLTKNNYAAVIAGFIFTFSAFHIAQSMHIHFINIEWIPLFLYFLIKIIKEERSYINILGMSASFALSTLMGNIEQTLMLCMVFVLIVLIYLVEKETRKNIISKKFVFSIAIFIITAFIIGSWNFIPLIKTTLHPGGIGTANFLNTKVMNAAWSVSPAGLFIPSYYNGIFYSISSSPGIYALAYAPDPIEKVAYIGYMVLALVLYGIYKKKKEILPWAVCTIVFLWLSFGPYFGLYQLYHALPAVNVIREPGRFDLIASMFIAILAAYGAKELFDLLQKHHGHKQTYMRNVYIVLIVILLLMFIENNGMPLGTGLQSQTSTNIQVPKLYSELSTLSGNFSILPLPTLPTSTTNQYLYPGEDTFFTAYSHKPIVGGYVGGRQNESSTLLLYNLPLAVESTSLIDNGTPVYQSPIIQNYTNQTLLSLYNYNTEFIVLHKQPYTTNELFDLTDYLLSVFGKPLYNDNTTMVFATANAINRSIFKSFVSFPSLTQWEAVSIFLNGSYQQFWAPVSPGAVVVYAPYANIATANGQYTSYINTTISFTAVSSAKQQLYIAEPTGNSTAKTIAVVNITTKTSRYSVRTQLASGPIGNELFFVYATNSTPVLLKDIDFTR